MANLFRIIRFTMRDQLRYKSLYLLMAACAVPLLLTRGCFSSEMVVNGHRVDASAVTPHLAAILFQVVSYAMFLVTALVSMKVFTRDRQDGSLVMILSRPVSRWQYLFGRVGGIWLLCFLVLMGLHLLILATAWFEAGLLLSAIPAASAVASLNLLLIILMVSLFSQYMPDIMAALFSLGIIAVGFVSETGFSLFQNGLFRAVVTRQGGSPVEDAAAWRVLYPKISMLQQYASCLISDSSFTQMGPVLPQVNVVLYLLIVAAALLVRFNRSEIS